MTVSFWPPHGLPVVNATMESNRLLAIGIGAAWWFMMLNVWASSGDAEEDHPLHRESRQRFACLRDRRLRHSMLPPNELRAVFPMLLMMPWRSLSVLVMSRTRF